MMKLSFKKVPFQLKAPFAITGYTFTCTDTVQVKLEEDGFRGQGEGVGVYYLGDTIDNMLSQLEGVADSVAGGVTHTDLIQLLPPGGARNALDCAFWDLTAKRTGVSVWDSLNLVPNKLKTVCTIGIGDNDLMAQSAIDYANYTNLKIKLDGNDPIGKLEAIRAVRPDATLIIDVNQGWTFEELKEYAPAAGRLNIAMIEQPLKRGEDDILAGFKSPVPLGADESCLDASEYAAAAERYDVINIKLDKCGGLTAGLILANMALKDNKALMVGNMTGSSLSMAPAYVIGQFCEFVDIDGPLLLADDVENPLCFGEGGVVDVPNPDLWG